MNGNTLRVVLATLCTGLALGFYVYGSITDAAFDPAARTQKELLRNLAKTSGEDLAKTRALAEAYWSRYPDVAADKFFGRNGSMGAFGPREHFSRHGQAEGRKWGL